jgi:hypothetical protein
VAGGQLASGVSYGVTILVPGNQILATFATAPENGTAASQAAAHVTFQVSKFNFKNADGSGSTVDLKFYEPDKTLFKTVSFTGVGPPFYAFNPPTGTSNGPWSVVLAPEGTATGTLALTFADNKANTELSSTVAAGATINVEGQYADYSFNATEGEQVTFRASSFNFTNGASGGGSMVNLVFYEPDGSLYTNPHPCYFTVNYSCAPITIPVGGTWFAFLEPVGPAVGSLTLTMS